MKLITTCDHCETDCTAMVEYYPGYPRTHEDPGEPGGYDIDWIQTCDCAYWNGATIADAHQTNAMRDALKEQYAERDPVTNGPPE